MHLNCMCIIQSAALLSSRLAERWRIGGLRCLRRWAGDGYDGGMFGYRIDFEAPGYLGLLALLPLLWWIGYRRLAALGAVRRQAALLLRSAVVLAVVCALAGVQLVRISDRLTVLYLLDQSDSIPPDLRRRSLEFAIDSVRQHRNAARQDQAGLIVFGRQAAVEVPPYADRLPAVTRLEGQLLRGDATDLEAALKLAQAVMPEETRRRIVLISDGIQTQGDARAAAARLAESGIGIDVVPVAVDAVGDVLVEKVDLPNDIRRGQRFEARVVLNHFAPAAASRPVRGRLNVTRRVGAEDELLLDQPIELAAGKNVIPLTHQIDQAAAYTYTATFIPESPEDDAIAENNRAEAYTYVRGRGRVLLIEPWDSPGQYQLMVDQLRQADIEVIVQPSNALFGSLAELQAYDAVILAGVPRSSGDSSESIVGFSDEQIEMLARSTQQLGCGLLMIGGPEALGAGGWAGTKLEQAMPVDFEIKNLKVTATGALQLVLDTSGSMQGEKLALCKAAAIQAVNALQPHDSIGLITFDTQPKEIVPMQRVGSRRHIQSRIATIAAGGGTDLFPAMELGYKRLRQADGSTRHMICLTDGLTPAKPFAELTRRMRDEGITVSSVAVGADADDKLMQRIATWGGGRMYKVMSPRAVPKILMREARRVSRGLIHEQPSGLQPEVAFPHAVLSGIDSDLPPLKGFVMTTPKSNPLVQTVLTSPVPTGQVNPLLSVWQYGLGRTAVWSTDAGHRWAADWTGWAGYEKFYTQLVRWLMRPVGESGKYSVATQLRDGQVKVVVSALDDSDDFLNFLPMNASVLDPEMKPVPLRLRQTAPGRYEGTFPAEASGNYFVNVVPQAGTAPLTTGVTVPYSDEYRLRQLNRPLLQSLASTKPRGGQPGQLLPPLDGTAQPSSDVANPFRSGLASDRTLRDIWPWLLLVFCWLFLCDIFVRRVAISFGWLPAAWAAIAGRAAPVSETIPRLDSLKAAKASVATAASERRGVRYQAVGQDRRQPDAVSDLEANPPDRQAVRWAVPQTDEPPADEHPSYTQRLLEAKRRASPRR